MRFWSALSFAALAFAAGPAAAEPVRVDYALSLTGMEIGAARLTGTADEGRYTLKLEGELSGLAGAITGSGRGSATAQGALAAGRLSSGGFAATVTSSSGERTLQIGLTSGNVTAVRIEPPFQERPDRVPLTPAHKQGIIDPLSALVAVPASRAHPLDPAACNRTIPVFDGTQRFDVVLSAGGKRLLRKPGYVGEVLVCNARYVPIAGHRAMRPAVKFMQDNKEMSVWLGPVEEGRLLVPLRISVMTTLGLSLIEAQRVGSNTNADGKAAPAR